MNLSCACSDFCLRCGVYTGALKRPVFSRSLTLALIDVVKTFRKLGSSQLFSFLQQLVSSP